MSTNLVGLRRGVSPYRVSVFHQTLIVSAQTDKEQDTCHVLETMDPLPPLALLATHVDHQHLMIPQVEARFRNADCSCPTLNDVLLVRNIVGIKKSFQVSEVIVQAV